MEILEYFPNLHIPSWAWNHSVDEPISNGGQVYGTDENFPNLIIFPVDGVSEKQKIIIIIIIFNQNHDLKFKHFTVWTNEPFTLTCRIFRENSVQCNSLISRFSEVRVNFLLSTLCHSPFWKGIWLATLNIQGYSSNINTHKKAI